MDTWTTGLVSEEPPVRSASEPPAPPPPPLGRWAPWLPRAAEAVAIVGVVTVVLWQLHPSLLLANTTTTGGDTGAHFIMPAFLKNQLLPHGRLTGWDPGWYAGYPIYTFYFVVPDLIAAVASYLIPYGVAFKLMTVLGSVLTPLGAWACGRLFGLRPPGPAALAAATLPFLFDPTWTIYGGNLFSTLAGEYAFSLSVPLALVFLGLFARGLRTGRGRGWGAVVLALCILTHVVPALLALGGAAVLTVLELRGGLVDGTPRPERTDGWRLKTLWWGCSTVGLGVLWSAWWLVPFLLDHDYMTQMGYQNVTTFVSVLFPRADLWVLVLAGAAVLVALWSKSRFGVTFGVLGAGAALGVRFDPQGALYNVRLLPLWFLCVYLLAGWFVAVLLRAAASAWRDWRRAVDPSWHARGRWQIPTGAVGGPVLALVGALVAVVPPLVLPASALPVVPGANQVTNWATWNYRGFEGAPAYPEFRALMATMTRVGRHDGCGRAMWEYDANENRFGTPEALMDLPYFTGGCIDSMEGLLFESSATTPYHFLDQAELSPAPSEPMVGLDYGPVDVPLGVAHLQLLGVRYLMVDSRSILAACLADPALHLVATTGPWHSIYDGQALSITWHVFRVSGSAPIVPLHDRPAVLVGVSQAQPGWLPVSESWFLDPARWDVELAAGGPPDWPRVRAGERPPRIPVVPTVVSHVVQETSTIAFQVTRTGSPVLVKTSYFPNWVAHGAEGPWRVTPNLMVVVPTRHHVTLTYGQGSAGRLGLALTGGAVVVALLALVSGRTPWARRRGRPRGPSVPPEQRPLELLQ
jgi:hypothetical protein